MAEENGVWRTIRGRRVFIRSGEDLESAMKRSGKFGTKFSPEETENLRKAGRETRAREIDNFNGNDKYSTSEHIGFGDYNKDKIPVYNNKIDYTGDFTRGDLKTLSNEELTTALNKQSELYHQASDENLGDQRTRNGRMNKIFNTAKIQQYEGGMKAISEEMEKRDLPRYNIYDDAGNIRVSSPTKEMAERELAEMYETDKSLQKSYGWKELPKYSIKEGKVDEYLNERKDTGEQTIPREKAQSFVKAFKTALEEEQNGYTQKVDWDGGTYEYSKDRLERMEQSGIKPLEHSYTGGGWQGTKYDSKLTTKEIAKTVQNELKKDFPDVKISRKTDYNSIDINIMSSEKDLYTSSSDIDRMSDKQVSDTIRDSIGGYTRMDDWLEKNNRKSANGTFTANDERDYLKEELETYRNRKGYRVTGDEWYLSDYGKQVVGSLNKNLNSYNYDDSDGMVDYFDTNFYGGVQIGKWDKPYVVEDQKIEAKVERFKKRKNK